MTKRGQIWACQPNAISVNLGVMNTEYQKMSKIFFKSRKWKVLRKEAIRLMGRTCMRCNKQKLLGAHLHVDHVIPRSVDLSRQLDITNLQILCKECNVDFKGTQSFDYRSEYIKHMLATAVDLLVVTLGAVEVAAKETTKKRVRRQDRRAWNQRNAWLWLIYKYPQSEQARIYVRSRIEMYGDDQVVAWIANKVEFPKKKPKQWKAPDNWQLFVDFS